MKKKAARGITGIEFIFFVIILSLIGGIGYYHGRHQQKIPMIADALLGHMKLMAANIKHQKSDLGSYPTSLRAMTEADEYFISGGNTSQFHPLKAEQPEWHGPYFKEYQNFSPFSQTKRYFQINLEKIYTGLTGGLIANKRNNKKVKYIVSWSGTSSPAELNEVFRYVIKKCNNEKDEMTVQAYTYTIGEGNPYKPCGYLSSFGNIVEINYYIGDVA